MEPAGAHELLVRELTASQNRLFAFIFAQLPHRDRAREVLQDVNLVIWRKADQFTPGTDFWAWAAQIARLQVLTYYRDRGRERLVFNEAVLEQLAAAAEQFSSEDDHATALQACLKKLPPRQRELVQRRYFANESVLQIAESNGRSAAAIKMALHRTRQALLQCIETALGAYPS